MGFKYKLFVLSQKTKAALIKAKAKLRKGIAKLKRPVRDDYNHPLGPLFRDGVEESTLCTHAPGQKETDVVG